MFKITPQLLRDVAGTSTNKEVVEGLVKYLPEYLERYNLNTRQRVAHFLAQIAHESDHFRTLEEYASGSAYEGRRDLGNVVRGDGRRYKGRGAIQLTGRFNYRKYGRKLGVDLENNPELAATPKISVLTALEYWDNNNLNALADRDDVKAITRRINGGYNGLQDRVNKLHRAKVAMRNVEVVPSTQVKQPEQPKVEVAEVVETPVAPLPIFAQLDLDKTNGTT